MRLSAFTVYAVCLSATTALTAGCGGSQPGFGTGGALIPQSIRATHPDHGKSWMSPAAKHTKALLYVSDIATYDVFVYDYKKGTLVGTITGIEAPEGQCVDKKGDVWIVGVANDTVVEYAHGGTQALQTLGTDSSPVGCSVDPTTGNLAVATFSSVDVFSHASGQKATYASSICFPFWSPGYDDRGNLYLLGLLYGSARPLSGYTDPVPCELPHKGTALRPVHTSGLAIVYPGGVMWDGEHLTVTDQDYQGKGETGIYRVKEDASGNLTAIDETVLTDDCGGTAPRIPQPFIFGKTVVGGDLQCRYNGSGAVFDYWKYPAGGNPKFSLQSPPGQPEGESVSVIR